MKRIGFIFPGQGSQYVGMGKELYENYNEAKIIFDEANDVLAFDIKDIIFNGSEETLRQTQYTQPAIYTVSVAAYKVLSSNFNIDPLNCFCAGHSLGEYSALNAAEVFSFNEGLKLVKARGEFIQKASEKVEGKMAAIIGLDKIKVQEICRESSDCGICEAVNYNSSEQIVIAGASDAINKAVDISKSAGALKAVILNVSGPFHSSLMSMASDLLDEELIKYNFNNPKIPVITNCDSEITVDSGLIKEKLVKQIKSPVYWEDSIKKMINNGVEVFIEVGPQRVLSGLLRRIDKSKKILNIEDQKSLEKTLQEIKQ